MNFNGTHPRIVKCKVEPTDGAAILISHGQLHLASAALHTAVPIRQFSLLKLILLTSKNRLVTSSN
jgi:hypothetical protein